MEDREQNKAQNENILEQLEWAEKNPGLVEDIVIRSTEFANTHLRPESGRDCYTLMLLHAYASLMDGKTDIPDYATHLFQKKPWIWLIVISAIVFPCVVSYTSASESI